MGNIYEVSDEFTNRFHFYRPAFQESFASFFQIQVWQETDIIAADIELKLKLALELREEAYLHDRHNNQRALWQHWCREANSSRHACRALVFGSIYDCCLQKFKGVLLGNSTGESVPRSDPVTPVPWTHIPTFPRHDLEEVGLCTRNLLLKRKLLQMENCSTLLLPDSESDRHPTRSKVA